MPFQLYPMLPSGASHEGVVKDELFKSLLQQRAPEMTKEQRLARVGPLAAAWQAEGLCLRSPPTGLNADGGGRMGSSFDAQRLILLARSQGREDAMIEEVYASNHSRDECLSDWSVLLGCASRAGVRDAEATLRTGWGARETLAKIDEYKAMGVSAVPVVLIDSVGRTPVKTIIASGAPETDFLRACFASLLETGRLPWKAGEQPPQALPTPPPAAKPAVRLSAGHSRVLQMLGSGSDRGGGGRGGGGDDCGGGGGGCAGGQCRAPLKPPTGGARTDENDAPVVNRLRGSLRRSSSRPHAFTIDADFVTCTQ